MNRNEIKISGTDILLSLFEKYKNQPWVLSSSEIENKKNSWFSGKWGQLSIYEKPIFGLQSGVVLVESPLWTSLFFLVDSDRNVEKQFKTLS